MFLEVYDSKYKDDKFYVLMIINILKNINFLVIVFFILSVIVNDYDLLGIFVVDVNVIDVDVIVSI